jgi:hypothetical protein
MSIDKSCVPLFFLAGELEQLAADLLVDRCVYCLMGWLCAVGGAFDTIFVASRGLALRRFRFLPASVIKAITQ